MVGTVTSSEEAQLTQTIEMFEVITQSQPQDYQSLEILKEAYVKLGREEDALNTSRRIAQAYVLLGQISSAILEYESIVQRFPDDEEAQRALQDLESKARGLGSERGATEIIEVPKPRSGRQKTGARLVPNEYDDGRAAMHKLFVDGKVITNHHFEECWIPPDLTGVPQEPQEPFIQVLADRGLAAVERSLKMLCEKSRLGFLPLEKYDIDVEFSRTFPSDICRRWCVLPVDRMSKSVLVATANPFNRQAAAELEEVAKQRLLWYLVPPPELIKALKKVFR